MKIHELSKELGVDNKDLIALANDLGIDVKSHLNLLTDEQEELIRIAFTETDVDEKQPIVEEPKQWKPDLNRMICIKNIARGRLIYKSKRQMGYMIVWENTNDLNYMELGEFINLKNSDRRFITEPWIRIMEDDEVEILKYANVYQYYKEMIEVNDIEDLFKLDFDRFKRKFTKLPQGYKNSVAEYAARMIREGTLDSIRIKKFIEKEMDISLDVLIPSSTDSEQTNKPKIIDIK